MSSLSKPYPVVWFSDQVLLSVHSLVSIREYFAQEATFLISISSLIIQIKGLFKESNHQKLCCLKNTNHLLKHKGLSQEGQILPSNPRLNHG